MSYLGWFYHIFFTFFGKEFSLNFSPPHYWDDALLYQWDRVISKSEQSLSVGVSEELDKRVRDHFLWADSLATYYANTYRAIFGLSFLAVLLAVLGLSFHEFSENLAIAEFTMILIVILLNVIDWYNNVHQCWLDFRLLAERLRQLVILMPLGGDSELDMPYYEVASEKKAADNKKLSIPSYAWVDWLMRAITCADGIPNHKLDDTFLKDYRKYLTTLVTDQADYHRKASERHHRINNALLGIILFACVIHVTHFFNLPRVYEIFNVFPSITAAVLPALGAAIAGLLTQGEFKRIAQRSKGMSDLLTQISDNLAEQQNPSSEELIGIANDAIARMSEELSDWRVLFHIKVLEIHA